MAVTTQKSTEHTNATATPVTLNPTTDYAGRVRIMYFTHDQSGAGDATSSVALGSLPAGKVKVLLSSSNACKLDYWFSYIRSRLGCVH